jgi:hypothetical protein
MLYRNNLSVLESFLISLFRKRIDESTLPSTIEKQPPAANAPLPPQPGPQSFGQSKGLVISPKLLRQLTILTMVSAPSALAIGLVYFLVHPFSSSPPKAEGGQASSVPPLSPLTWSSVTEGSEDLVRRYLSRPSATSYSNPDRILSALEKPSFSNGIALPMLLDLPENTPGRFTAGLYQGQTEPWISNLSRAGEINSFDSILQPVEEIQKIAEEAQRISGWATFPRTEFNMDLSSILNWVFSSIRQDNNQIQKSSGPALVPVPTPALLPGMVAFGLGLMRKRKQDLVS